MKRSGVLSVVIVSLSLVLPARAQNIQEPPGHFTVPEPIFTIAQELDLVEQAVEADIRDRLAEVKVASTFENRTGRQVEGVYLFPLPPQASVSRFRMEMGGKVLEGEILEASRARQIYESFLRRIKDPGLLDMLKADLIRTRVFPVPPGARATIHVSYSHLVQGNPAVFRAPFFGKGRSPAALASLRVRIEEKDPLKSIYSPSHPAARIERLDARHASVNLELRSVPEWNGFVLYFDASTGDLGTSFLTYRDSDQGFWALLLSPGLGTGGESTLPRDFVFLLDRSGSMQGRKIEQAKSALETCIARLSEKDRFNVVSFATGIEDLGEGLLAANPDGKGRAGEAVRRIQAEGGTNLHDALEAAFRKLPVEEGRVPCVFLISDGVPTVGITDPSAITRDSKGWNRARARLFCFGVGNDVNTALLDNLAQDHQGARDYVAESEGVSDKVTMLFAKLSAPVLKDIKVSFSGINASDLIPKTPGDLYLGDQMVLCGRYRGDGKAVITIEGRLERDTRKIEIPVEFPQRDARQESVASLWARRRIGFLLDEIRLSGARDKELVDEIIDLSRRYRIVTPYTAFLITEEGDLASLHAKLERRVLVLQEHARLSGFQRDLTPVAAAESVLLDEAKK